MKEVAIYSKVQSMFKRCDVFVEAFYIVGLLFIHHIIKSFDVPHAMIIAPIFEIKSACRYTFKTNNLYGG